MDRQLKRGRPLTEALRSALPSLPAYVFQLVAAGVETGELGAALRDAANQMEYEDRLRQDMRTALTYPTILVVSGLAAVLFIFTAVVPRFSVMFSGRFGELPALSRVVLGMGNAVHDNLVVVVCLLAGAAGLVVLAARQPFVRLAALELGLKLPVLGPWLAQSEIARWSTMAAKLLGNRIPLMRVLELARGGLRSVTLADQMLQVERMVRTGVSLSKALADHTDLESTSVNLVRIGEHAGKLPEMLKSLAEMHDKAGRDRLKRVLLLVEPVAILLIGGIIGVFITAVILAITSVNQIPI
jgi:general secretion pathway protein F